MMKGHEFADKICGFMGWIPNPKKSNDGGIDGWAMNQTIPIQIKNHRNKIGRPDIQKFVGALNSVSPPPSYLKVSPSIKRIPISSAINRLQNSHSHRPGSITI